MSKFLLPLLISSTVALFALSLLVGPSTAHSLAQLAALFGLGNDALILVMQEIRLPRALLGVMVGASLGSAGAVLQGFLRNPLAEPGLIGTSSAATLGAVIAIHTGIAASFPLGLPLMALLASGLSVIMMLGLASRRGGTLAIILAGIAVSALCGAATSLALNLSPNPFAANDIIFWMMGSLTDRSMVHVWLMLPFMLFGMLLLTTVTTPLRLLTLGEDVAASSGVNFTWLRWALIGSVASMVGAATAVTGSIGFIGLVVPHLLRRAVGSDPARLVPASAFGGAIMVLLADIAIRVFAPDRDLKLGVLTALIGTPFFLHIILQTQRRDL